MATAYSALLGLALPVQGELSGTWGDTVNNYITNYLDASVAGTQTLSTDADVTLTKTTGAALNGTSSQYAIINCTGARTVLRTITAPSTSKKYVLINATTGGFGVKLVGAGPTTGVTVAAGTVACIVWNGTDFALVSVLTSAGVVPVANGGTGATSNAGAAFALKGANSDITSLAGLTTPLSVVQGGTGATTNAGAAFALKGVNTDITSLASPALAAATATTQASTDNSTKVATTAYARALDLGVDQTWQTVTRTSGTTYTNSTGKPILLLVNGVNLNGGATIAINGANVYIAANANITQTLGPLLIPIGATYVLTSASGYTGTQELR
jgi:hypothetical protein